MIFVLASDNNFVQHCVVTIVSIFRNNKKSDICFYILTEGLTDENEAILIKVVSENAGKLFITNVDKDILKDVPMPDDKQLSHISIATYYRLFISKLLPKNIDKVIYLDCDIIVRQSLNELWEYNIENSAIAAVYQIVDWNISAIKRLKYPVEYGYFNAGVLLINLAYWREHQIPDLLLSFVHNNKELIVFHDQDVLNGVLYDKCLKLPCKWNMLSNFFQKNTLSVSDFNEGILINDYKDYKQQILQVINNPAIIHFVFKPKPWNSGCDHPYKKDYFFYLKYTPFYNYRPPSLFVTLISDKLFLKVWAKKIIRYFIFGSPYIDIKKA